MKEELYKLNLQYQVNVQTYDLVLTYFVFYELNIYLNFA